MPERKRVFIAINLPKDLKQELSFYQKKFSQLPAKWVEPENLHLTIVFLGHLYEKEISKVINGCETISKKHKSFPLTVRKVCYGPLGFFPPRMVWAILKSSPELTLLKDNIEQELKQIINYKPEEKGFLPHITLARLKGWEFRNLEWDERVEIEEEINSEFKVFSFELMESILRRKGAQYSIIKSFSLLKK